MSARILPNSKPEPKAQELLTAIEKKLGVVPNIFKTMAHSPAVLQAYLNFSDALNTTKLSPQLKELLALVVAKTNGCDYCASAHTAIGRSLSLSAEDLQDSLVAKAKDAKTTAALVFAREIVTARGNVSADALAAIRAAKYSETEIVEIVAVVALNMFTNYFNHVAGTEVDFPLVRT